MESSREYFCRGATMTAPMECESALCLLESDSRPSIEEVNDYIWEEKWTHFLLGWDVAVINQHCRYCEKWRGFCRHERELAIHSRVCRRLQLSIGESIELFRCTQEEISLQTPNPIYSIVPDPIATQLAALSSAPPTQPSCVPSPSSSSISRATPRQNGIAAR